MALNRTYELMGLNMAIAMGEDAFVEQCYVPSGFNDELALRVKRDGFSYYGNPGAVHIVCWNHKHVPSIC